MSWRSWPTSAPTGRARTTTWTTSRSRTAPSRRSWSRPRTSARRSTRSERRRPRRSARRGRGSRAGRASEADHGRLQGSRPPALVDRLADRQVLNRQARRVEERDLLGPTASLLLAVQHVPQLDDVVASDDPSVDAVRELAARAGLLPLVAEEPATLDRIEVDLLLAVRVGAQDRQVLSGAEVRIEEHELVARRHRDDDVLGGGLAAIAR